MTEPKRAMGPNGENCTQCRFFDGYEFIDGECRRHAPAVLLRWTNTGQVADYRYPPVNRYHWCGDFEPGLHGAADRHENEHKDD